MPRRRSPGAGRARPASTACPTSRPRTPCTSPTSGRPARRTASPSSRLGSSATRPRSTPGGAARTRRGRRASTSSPLRAARARSARSTSRTSCCRDSVGGISVAFQQLRQRALRRGRLRRAGEGIPRLLRRPDRPVRRRARVRPGCARELRASRHGGRLPRLLRRRRRRLAAAGGGRARARARVRRRRAIGAELLPERPRLRLRARPDDRHPVRRGARGARAGLGAQRLLRPRRQLERRAGLDLPRAARLARPDAADGSGRAPGRRRSDRLRPLLVDGLDGRRRPGCLPPLRGRRLRPADVDDVGALARAGRDDALLGPRCGHGRTSQRPSRACASAPTSAWSTNGAG